MDTFTQRRPGATGFKSAWTSTLLILFAFSLSACGGGAGTTTTVAPTVAQAQCNPSDPATTDECGTVLIGMTDDDGEFLSYNVDIIALQLETASGVKVDVLPNRTRIDFAEYVDLTEFVSAAVVPPANYVAGTIILDYSDAEIFVEADGAAKEAVVVDADGNPLQESSLRIQLANQNHLVIAKGRAALLTLDFDLDASHTVDIAASPAIAVSEPFIVADVDPVDTRNIRVRGRLIEANVEEMYYAVTLRPFYDTHGDFGRIKINVTERTDFEVNEEPYMGAEGLRALNDAGAGTLTVAQGTLDVTEREFTADIVLAGSSVPGSGKDAVKGNVISRLGSDLLVRGGTVILSDGSRAFFRDDVTVTVGPDTVVYKSFKSDRPLGMPIEKLDIAAISTGQAVTVRGIVTDNDGLGVHIDASEGTVAMHLTHLSGIVNTVMTGQTDIALHAIDRRRVGTFDFTGTGMSPDTDADPDNYEVATGNLPMSSLASGKPIVVYGFPNEFGAAPPDFEGRTVIDYADVRSALGVGWGAEGTPSPFLMLDNSGLLLDNDNADIDQRHHIKQGPVLIDLTSLDSSTLIAPRETGRNLFTVKTRDSLQLYASFEDFVQALSLELDGASKARSMYARGHYNADTNVFQAYRIFVYILEAQ